MERPYFKDKKHLAMVITYNFTADADESVKTAFFEMLDDLCFEKETHEPNKRELSSEYSDDVRNVRNTLKAFFKEHGDKMGKDTVVSFYFTKPDKNVLSVRTYTFK